MVFNLNWNTPVVILSCRIGGLAIMRSLGRLGVPLYGVDASNKSPALRSRYLKKYYIRQFIKTDDEDYLKFLINTVASHIGKKAVLIPTSDDLSYFVAKNTKALEDKFIFPKVDVELVDDLADKRKMYETAVKHGVPTPHTSFPQTKTDLLDGLDTVRFPVMLKAIDGAKLHARTGLKMVICRTRGELIENFALLHQDDDPNLMIQELIPGGDDQVYIYNGYFNQDSRPLISFTGYKIRQTPIHVGCASLGESRWIQQVADTTISLMQAVRYWGILDIGYRLDPRDGNYKVLDINPRVGQAFRLFVADNDMDVVRSLYIDLTGQRQPASIPVDGRRWVIEDFDLISTHDYFREGSLGFLEWVSSFRGLKEAAWFDRRDLKPFLHAGYRMLTKFINYIRKCAKRWKETSDAGSRPDSRPEKSN